MASEDGPFVLHVPEDLRRDKAFWMVAVSKVQDEGASLKLSVFCRDAEIVRSCVAEHGLAIRGSAFRDDDVMAKLAIENDFKAVDHVSLRLKAEYASLAASRGGGFFSYTLLWQANDADVDLAITAAKGPYGHKLEHAVPEHTQRFLEFRAAIAWRKVVHRELQEIACPLIAEFLVAEDGLRLEKMSQAVRKTQAVCLAAVRNDKEAVKFIDPGAWNEQKDEVPGAFAIQMAELGVTMSQIPAEIWAGLHNRRAKKLALVSLRHRLEDWERIPAAIQPLFPECKLAECGICYNLSSKGVFKCNLSGCVNNMCYECARTLVNPAGQAALTTTTCPFCRDRMPVHRGVWGVRNDDAFEEIFEELGMSGPCRKKLRRQ